MGVGVGGDVDVGVAEEVLDGLHLDACFEHEGGAGVPQVVKPNSAQAGLVAQTVELAQEGGGFQVPAGRGGEDQIGVLPELRGPLFVGGLLFAAAGEGVDDFVG